MYVVGIQEQRESNRGEIGESREHHPFSALTSLTNYTTKYTLV